MNVVVRNGYKDARKKVGKAMREAPMLERMKAVVREKDICVLATVSGDKPHCSLMAYAADDDCREIYMVTHRKTNKYKNLKENPAVSLLIDTREELSSSSDFAARALTVSGVFQEIDKEDKREDVRARLLERHPNLVVFLDSSDAELLCIRVKSFLLLDGLTDAHYEVL
jgi:nitroimidazol reductase NimA-like FMN-containing flavoprotein (pyridoxamine 5'-phosphate oxidase superfamily)